MATVDEILTRQAYAAGDDIWTEDSRYPSYRLYVEPEYVPVTNKRIADFNDQVSVCGERNAQYIGYRLPRYDDGIDLRTQNLYIHYQTAFGGGDSVPCNVSWSDNYVRICWMVPAQATQEPDRVQMMIYATGTNSAGDRVIWKTLPASYTIHDGLEIGGGIPEPDTSWYEQFVQQMEGKVSTAQGYADDAQASRTEAAGFATAAAESAAASAQALKDNKDYVESQKETFVGYNKRETDLKYANALVGSASGTGRITIGDAWEAPIPGMDITGRSKQFSTTGAQLLDISKITPKTIVGITFTPKGDGTIEASGSATAFSNLRILDSYPDAGDYYISGCPAGGNSSKTYCIKVYVSDGSTTRAFVDIGDGALVTIPEGARVFIDVTLNNGVSGPLVFKPMFSKGNTPKPCEPYSGGKPSPSPEYPQPIKGTGTVSTGAQMLNLDGVEQQTTIAGITFTINTQNGTITANGTATEVGFLKIPISIPKGEKIYIGAGNTSVVPSVNPQVILRLSGDNGVEVSSNTYLTTQHATNIFTTTQHCNFLHFRFGDKEVMNNFVIKPVVARSDKPLPWEPYTEGKPSPSPEYPQPLDVTVMGEQLFDASKVPSKTAGGATVTNNGDGSFTISGNGALTGTFKTYYELSKEEVLKIFRPGVYTLSANVETYPVPGVAVRHTADYSLVVEFGLFGVMNKTAEITQEMIDDESLYFELYFYGKSGSTVVPGTVTPMLNAGPTAQPWQPYQSRTETITLTEPLHGIGDERDRIMCRDGVWGIERNILLDKLTSSIVSASSGGVTTSNNVIDNKYTAITCEAWKNIIKKGLYENGKKTIGFCTIAPPGMINDWNTSKNGKENVYTINAAGAMYISIPISALDIIADITREEVTAAVKQYVTDHDVFVGFVLDTPTWEPLPSATQSTLNALTTYTGTTHVTITAGGPEPDVGLEYVMDTRAVIADLQAQIDEIRGGTT